MDAGAVMGLRQGSKGRWENFFSSVSETVRKCDSLHSEACHTNDAQFDSVYSLRVVVLY